MPSLLPPTIIAHNLFNNGTSTTATPIEPMLFDAEQWGRQRFAIFLAASIGLYAGLGLMLLACIGIVWRRRRRLNRRRLRAGASSAAVSSSSAAAAAGSRGVNGGLLSNGHFAYSEWLLSSRSGARTPIERNGVGGVDPVRLIKELNCSGQYSVVYEAELETHPDESQQCAAKLFWPELPASIAEYRSELAAYRRLGRANAVTFFPRLLGTIMFGGQRPCLLLELATGGTLSHQLADRCYTWSDFCRLSCGLCAAVAQLHSLGRAHCRLETDSFVLRLPLAPLLVGLSGCWSSTGAHLRYTAPELLASGAVSEKTPLHQAAKRNGKLQQQQQQKGSLDLEQRMQADSYSLGLILWEVATRCAAFYPASESPPPYAPVFADRLKLTTEASPDFSVDAESSASTRHRRGQSLTLASVKSIILADQNLIDGLRLPVENHPALPFIAETLAECWTPANAKTSDRLSRPTPASLHARFSSLAPNFV